MRAGDLELELAAPPAGVTLEVRVAEPIGDAEHWSLRVLAEPDGSLPLIRGSGTLETTDGWPVTVIRCDRGDGSAQVYALFVIDEDGIVVIARGAQLDAVREQLLELFRNARPRFAGGIAALAEVWEGL